MKIIISTLLLMISIEHVFAANYRGIEFIKPKAKEHFKKVRFADLERKFPLKRSSLKKLKPSDLKKWNQEELDQLYARLPSGEMPDGHYKETVILAEGGGINGLFTQNLDRLTSSRLLRGSIASAAKITKGLGKLIINNYFKGKYFENGVSRNVVSTLGTAFVSLGFEKSITDRITKVNLSRFPGKSYTLFPAKVFCGQSLLDSRRESIIIDHGFGQDLEGYLPEIDSYYNYDGLNVKKEIRMIRPGFYLGKIYFNRIYIGNFTLYRKDKRTSAKSACWGGDPKLI